MSRERPIRDIPRLVVALVAVMLVIQIVWHGTRPAPEATAAALPTPLPLEQLRAVSLGDPVALAKLLMLWLQAFDNQPGISIPFKELDYDKVTGWMERILQLDPDGQYPLLAASRVYGEVPVEAKQRQMLAFVYDQFLADPNRRWPWLAHAIYVAKHRLEDLPLAYEYARALREHATGENVPHWARQMELYVLEDMGELESAKVLIGGLLESGTITDPHEIWFLTERLKQLEQNDKGSSDEH